MTTLSNTISELQRRRKNLSRLGGFVAFSCASTFIATIYLCHGGDAFGSHREGDHFVQDVKGQNVTISSANYEKARPLEILSLVYFAGCWCFAVSDLVMIRKIRAAEGELVEQRDLEAPAG